MIDKLFYSKDLERVKQRPGVIKLLHAKHSNPVLTQLEGFSLAVVCRLTPHQLNILDVDEITDLLISEHCPPHFTWRVVVMLTDKHAKQLFDKSVDAMICAQDKLNPQNTR